MPGSDKIAPGAVSMIENTVDATTGMATVRATMPNDDELLWPGTLVNIRITLREEQAVVVPTAAVQVSQQGTFVFVVKDGVATVAEGHGRAASSGRESVIELRADRRRKRRHERPSASDQRRAVTIRERKAGA